MIGICNIGLGNISSISSMLNYLNIPNKIVSDPNELYKVDKIILPGVGSFDSAMKKLNSGDWLKVLNERVLEDKVPILGICLGMQVMTYQSEEGEIKGLGWIPGRVERFKDIGMKIPHMGWNIVHSSSDKLINLYQDFTEVKFYFVHSYYVNLEESDMEWFKCTYGHSFTAGLKFGNIHGVQFHPEKSHKYGFKLFEYFANI